MHIKQWFLVVIIGIPGTLFSPSSKKKKIHSKKSSYILLKKYFLIFCKIELSSPKIKYFLIFSQKKVSLILREIELSSPKIKEFYILYNTLRQSQKLSLRKFLIILPEKNSLWKNFLYFRKWNFVTPNFGELLYLRKELAKRENQNSLYFFKKVL